MSPDSTGPSAAHERLRVFISAKSADYEHAERVYRFLADAGVATFFSRESLPALGNTAYLEEIDHALAEVDHMVVVTTSVDNVLAPWVAAEWRAFIVEQRAGRKRGNLLTVVVGALEFSDLPLSLRLCECLRFDAVALDKLLRYVREPPAGRHLTAGTPLPPPSAPRRGAFRELATFGGPPRVNVMAVRPGEPSIATGGFDGAVRLYEADTRTRRFVIGSDRYWMAGAEGLITALEFSPDGRRVASGHLDGTLHAWEVDSDAPHKGVGREELAYDLKHDSAISGLAFSADGRTLTSASKDGVVKFWDLAALRRGGGPLPNGFDRKPAPVVSLARLNASGWLVTGLINTTTRRYMIQVQETGATNLLASIGVADGFVLMKLSDDGRLLALGGGDGIVRLYDFEPVIRAISQQHPPTSLTPKIQWQAHKRPIKSIAFFPDGRRLVSCAMNTDLTIWDLETGKASIRLQGAPPEWTDPGAAVGEAYAGAAVLGDGTTLVAAVADGRVRLWEAV